MKNKEFLSMTQQKSKNEVVDFMKESLNAKNYNEDTEIMSYNLSKYFANKDNLKDFPTFLMFLQQNPTLLLNNEQHYEFPRKSMVKKKEEEMIFFIFNYEWLIDGIVKNGFQLFNLITINSINLSFR